MLEVGGGVEVCLEGLGVLRGELVSEAQVTGGWRRRKDRLRGDGNLFDACSNQDRAGNQQDAEKVSWRFAYLCLREVIS